MLQTGVWLVHSTLELPDVKNHSTSFLPSSGHENAQTFFCGTYTYSTFKDIVFILVSTAVQLQYIHVYSFDYHVPQTFHRDLQCVAQRTCYPRKEPWFKQLPLTSLAGWGKLHRPLLSNCSVAHKVYNVKTMQLPEARPFGIMVDHSKWCVMKGGGPHWTCIADTNREIRQTRRGGGAVCTSRPGVWKAFLTVVDTFEDCQ
ncbi:deoxyribonuclease-2-beta-like [Lepisosteus oculatus]|uniref:deoxyribonuclease-2-beta-like n=1 Tax=Lepisosteus oculatus TaxID=7918 RepID=UPI003724A9E6